MYNPFTLLNHGIVAKSLKYLIYVIFEFMVHGGL